MKNFKGCYRLSWEKSYIYEQYFSLRIVWCVFKYNFEI